MSDSNIILNKKAVDVIIETISTFKLVSGSYAGKPFVVLPWQKDFIFGIFGKWYKDTRTRVVNEALLSIAKKNGKTELVAAITLCFCIISFLQQKEGEIVIVSGTRDQASILFGVIKKFVEYDKYLINKFTIVPSKKLIIHKVTNMHIKIIASDADTAQGINPYVVIIDEIGNIAKEKAQNLLDGLANAFGAQVQPLMMMLSTQSADHSHPFSLKVNFTEKIKAGEIKNDEFFGATYTVPEELDIKNPENWHLANPSMNDIPSLKKQIEKSLATAEYNPASMAKFRQYLMNQRYSAEVTFVGRETWMKCQAEFDISNLKGCKAWGGIDLGGGKNDLSSFVLVIEGKDDDLYVVSYFWTGSYNLYDKSERDGVPYLEWKKLGYLMTTDGETTNWREMTQAFVDICKDFDVEEIWYDRWKIYEIERELRESGEHLPLIAVGQGFKDMTPCVDALENYLYERKIWHNNPILTWNVSNAVISLDPAGGKKFDKKKAVGRIDGCVALAQAVRCHEVNNVTASSEVVFI